jgi:regulator of cell morphogenesis and NO signaling
MLQVKEKIMPVVTQTVREIALQEPSSMRVFEGFGIDYCCGGRKPLAEACIASGVEVAAVIAALAAAATTAAPVAEDWQHKSMEELASHIVATHHAYVKRELPRLATLAQKVVNRHGTIRAELPAIQSAVATLDAELTQHLAKEEAVLFPYIAQLERTRGAGIAKPDACFSTVAHPIAMMTQEHDAAGVLLAEIRRLSHHFTTPEDACPTYHAFYDGLRV